MGKATATSSRAGGDGGRGWSGLLAQGVKEGAGNEVVLTAQLSVIEGDDRLSTTSFEGSVEFVGGCVKDGAGRQGVTTA